MSKIDQESSKTWVAPPGLTLPELHAGLGWFGINVTLSTLRQALRELDMEPFAKGPGRNGRGHSSYYDFSVLWALASAYHASYSPKTKFEKVRELLSRDEHQGRGKFSISEFFVDERVTPVAVRPARDHTWLRTVYMRYATHPDQGMDLRIVTDVAREHWVEVGLDDEGIRVRLANYKRHTLERLGVPAEVTATLDLI